MIEYVCPWGKRMMGRLERSPDSRLHFSLLPANLKHAYQTVVDACYAGSTQAYLPITLDRDDITALNEAVRWDNPSLLRVPSLTCSVFPNGSTVQIGYSMDREEEARMAAKIAPVVERLTRNTQGMDAYETELFVHDYLASTVIYDLNRPLNHQAFGPLVNGYGICSGISMSYAYVLNSLGIDCCTVYGRVNGSDGLHAWNVVNLEGENYHVDVTFDLRMEGRGISHEYFNLDDEAMRADRECMIGVQCGGSDYNFYHRSGSDVDTMNELSATVEKQIPKGILEFRLGSDLAYRFDSRTMSRFVEDRIVGSNSRRYSRICTSLNNSTGCCTVRLT